MSRDRRANLTSWFMGIFFHLIYNQFAWTYDLVANLVSLGNWTNWVKSISDLIEPIPTLELGFGPGHLQKHLSIQGTPIYGLDLSKQMSRIATRRLKADHIQPNLIQSSSTRIPLADNSFSQVIATFPSEYILQPNTILEIKRILKSGGCLIILAMAEITGKSPMQRLLDLIYRFTGQTVEKAHFQEEGFLKPLTELGFSVDIIQISKDFYTLTFIKLKLITN